MCVAVTGTVVRIEERSEFSIPCRVDYDGVEADADLIMVPEATVGTAVVVHSGYAISVAVPSDLSLRTDGSDVVPGSSFPDSQRTVTTV